MKTSLYDKVMAEYQKTKKKFIGYYCTYATSLNGDTVIEAIKYFNSCYNATLLAIVEFDLNNDGVIGMFVSKKNKKPDIRGRLNCSFYKHPDGILVYDEDENTKPLNKLSPSKINSKSWHGYIDRNGNFYECGFEAHKYLAEELFITKTISELTDIEIDKYLDHESVLDNMGWVKVSSKRIHYRMYNEAKRILLTRPQKNAIIKFMDEIGQENYEFQYIIRSKQEIINELNDDL